MLGEGKERTIADYQCIEIKNGDGLPTIVMFHGYGANMRDLAPLASISPDLQKFNWIFPNGPLAVPIGPHMFGQAWFPIDMTRFETGDIGDLYCSKTPEGMNEACENIEKLLDVVKEETPSLIFGGFSQGSMMALETVLKNKYNPKGLILLSSTLVNRTKLNERKSHLTCPIFQSHGSSDMVLPVEFARELRDEIKDLDLTYHEFQGGHEIPPPVLFDMISFLKEL